MTVHRLTPDWPADAIDWALTVMLLPLWVPAKVLDDIRLRAQTAPLVRGRVEEAWQRCRDVWREWGQVCQFTAHDGAAFGHELAVALARKHRGQRAFFLARVADPDPLLVAYAFKCLIRTGPLRREDLPAGALERVEPIPVLWADMVDDEPLGVYLEGWFREQEVFGAERDG